MKNSIAYSQALHLNKICYNKSDIEKNDQKLLTTLTNWRYDKSETMSHINKAIAVPRNEILNKNQTENNEKIPSIVTFNRTLPNLRHIVYKNWYILQIEPKLKEIFKNLPVVAFKRNKNLHAGNEFYNNKKTNTCKNPW